jgi:hypothetical protein
MPVCIQMSVPFIPHYAVTDSSKYTFRITVKGLCVLGYGDSQCFAPIIRRVYRSKYPAFLFDFTAQTTYLRLYQQNPLISTMVAVKSISLSHSM